MRGKEKSRSIIYLVITLVVLAGLIFVTTVGIGKAHQGSARNISLGLDLAGGVSITYVAATENPTDEQMNDTVYKIQQRVQGLNTESAVYREGSDRINVDIPGVTNANEILAKIGKAGSIQFVDEAGKVVIDGADISTAKAGMRDGTGGLKEYVVDLELNAKGSEKFAEATAANIGKSISIVYDGTVLQSPVVQGAITEGKAEINGQQSFEKADELASTIRIGALPLELNELRSTVVGAKLGAEAVNTSLLAGIIGIILVVIFMIAAYRLPGVCSAIALTIYVGLMLFLLNAFNITLTLPGIAGIILSIGMAVDANVIIFTRIKEEISSGKTVQSAIKLGFQKALSAIVDGNVTTLIAAAVLWFKGSGTVKGFAQTLALGIVLSMFTALVITRTLMNAGFRLGLTNAKLYGVKKEREPIDFVKHAPKFYIVSAAIICAGIIGMVVNMNTIDGAFNYGLDFKGGTSTNVTFNEAPPSNKEIEDFIFEIVQDSNIEVAPVADSNAVLIRTKELNLDQRTQISDKFVETYGVDPQLITTESISGAVSAEMKSDAVVALALAVACMLVYIWIRFKDIKFGVGAVIGLMHDIFAVVAIYAIARISVGNTFIACILTILGYSINSTIVIFDRIRENLALQTKKKSLREVVNSSITQTITRSINTTLTTFIMVAVLYVLGVESIKDFALPLIGGIVVGAFSSVCLAGTLWYYLKTKIVKKTSK